MHMSSDRFLLAVDLGLKMGMALFDGAGRLRWYRSHHFANNSALRRSVHRILREIENLEIVCIEGGGNLGVIWEREASKLNIAFQRIGAETWRNDLLFPRDRRSGKQAKRKADEIARKVIGWSDAPRPTSLRHDASEAILIGLWGVLDAGWLKAVPGEFEK